MIIDTGKKSIKSQSLKQIFGIISIVIVVLIITTPIGTWITNHLFSEWWVVVAILSAYLCYLGYFFLRDIEYFYATDTELKGFIRVRHFQLRPFVEKRIAIEIPFQEFHGYREEYKLGRLRHYVILSQKRGSQVYDYPPFSVTILKKGQLKEFFMMLDKYAH